MVPFLCSKRSLTSYAYICIIALLVDGSSIWWVFSEGSCCFVASFLFGLWLVWCFACVFFLISFLCLCLVGFFLYLDSLFFSFLVLFGSVFGCMFYSSLLIGVCIHECCISLYLSKRLSFLVQNNMY